MKLYYCCDCDRFLTYEELKTEHDTYENVYGVSSMFPDSHSFNYKACPYCGSGDIDDDFTEEEIVDMLNNNNRKAKREKWTKILNNCIDPNQHKLIEEFLKDL